MSVSQPRKPKGAPVGGQFAPKSHPESAVAIEPSWPGLTSEVRIGSEGRTESWQDSFGRLQDPPDGSPARRWLRPDGTVDWEEHFRDGDLQDPPDGSPAVRWFHLDESVEYEAHWQGGQLQDPPDGSPAVRSFHPDGSVKYEAHWQDGRQVS
jgi:hypothetical protein